MAASPPILIRFTPEELAVLFDELASPEANLDFQDLLPEYSDEQRTLAMRVARRSLVAREVVHPAKSDDGSTLHTVAQAAMAAMLRDEPSVLVFRQKGAADLSSSEYHAFGEAAYLAHWVTPDEVHEFAIFEDAESYGQAIVDGLALTPAGQLACPPGKLTQAAFSRSIELAESGDLDKVQAALSGPSLPKKTAELLAATLSGPYEFKTVVLPEAGGESATDGSVLSFLQGQNGLWQMEGFAGGLANGLVSVKPLTDAAARTAIQKFLKGG